MELSTELMDVIGKDVLDVLKQATKEEIVFKSEANEDSVETEIEEIIEIIEEVEEEEDDSSQDNATNALCKEEIIETTEFNKNSTEVFSYEEDTSTTQIKQETGSNRKYTNTDVQESNKKQLIAYDVHEDWQDEEMEQVEEMEVEIDQNVDLVNVQVESYQNEDDKKGVNNSVATYSSSRNKLASKDNTESGGRMDKSKVEQDFENDVNNIDNNDHEIVKNVENNLLYTVLGTKKQNSAKAQQTDAQYIKMEQLSESTIPIEGTIYYEGDNMETLYVAQAVEEGEQYQYDVSTVEQEEQVWETTNSDNNQNQDEENSQDQIFLHEDEDGQLYFKDDNGALQPVYLTEDGNYAIAESTDEPEDKESMTKIQQNTRLSEEESFNTSDVELRSHSSKQNSLAPSSSGNDLDNEDNTVTISLIISEDEHGQKRTQVIIPTTDSMKCDICNKSFKTSFQLLRHNRLKHAREEDITTRNFPCDLCPKRYPDQNSLARHRKTHTGDRPFQCLECHKNFPTSTALRRHLTLHNSQSRPLPCIYCGRRFIEKASLAKHEQSHLAGDQRTNTCDVCQKSFLNATDLSLHKKYHDPDKKFDCEVCGREFNRLNNLQRHMMVHQQQGANEEILSCDVCGITYKFMSSLTRHMVTTHMNPEKLRQQAEEQRRKRENNYRRYLENRKMYETQHSGGFSTKRTYHQNARVLTNNMADSV